MRTLTIGSLSLSAVALLVLAAGAAAQEAPPATLNAVEMRQLIARGEPGDHARLSAHFAALADRDAAEGKRHGAMSQGAGGSPTRDQTASLRAHCTQLAKLNAESAVTLRELATHHQRLAVGASSVAPTTGTKYHEGAGASVPTELELIALAANARTSADHRSLETYFLTQAKRHTSAADDHSAMAGAYRSARITGAAVHCDRLVALSRDSAKQAAEAAAVHKQLGGAAR